MKVLLFGATGMVGQGILRECLLDPEVTIVKTIGRNSTGQHHEKLGELIYADLFDYSGIDDWLTGFDACFFALGVSSFGMKEKEYTHITYDLTLAAATTLARLNPQMTFVYVSGASTDSTEKGSSMWARVKGRTENALLRLPFRAAYMFRPGLIVALHGIQSRTALYRIIYKMIGPLVPLAHRFWPNAVLTTEEIGKAMISVARNGAPKQILEVKDIRTVLNASESKAS
jgi:uncharacterized protein YbjT (DUF2867 family)